jgi:hypothetical protein
MTVYCPGWIGKINPKGRSVAGRIMSMKNSNDTIGNRTRDFPACTAVPQPTAPPRAPVLLLILPYFLERDAKYSGNNFPTFRQDLLPLFTG